LLPRLLLELPDELFVLLLRVLFDDPDDCVVVVLEEERELPPNTSRRVLPELLEGVLLLPVL
jgi:hypothetical protein